MNFILFHFSLNCFFWCFSKFCLYRSSCPLLLCILPPLPRHFFLKHQFCFNQQTFLTSLFLVSSASVAGSENVFISVRLQSRAVSSGSVLLFKRMNAETLTRLLKPETFLQQSTLSGQRRSVFLLDRFAHSYVGQTPNEAPPPNGYLCNVVFHVNPTYNNRNTRKNLTLRATED